MGAAGAEPFRVLRIVRLPRVFKVFKMGKYSEGLILIAEGLKRSSAGIRRKVNHILNEFPRCARLFEKNLLRKKICSIKVILYGYLVPIISYMSEDSISEFCFMIFSD